MKVGILGAGQLARMLVQAGQRMHDCECIIFTSGTDECVRDLKVEVRPFPNIRTLEKLFSDLDFITFENEFIDLEPFKALQLRLRARYFPSLDVIELVQDKLKQKKVIGPPRSSDCAVEADKRGRNRKRARHGSGLQVGTTGL